MCGLFFVTEALDIRLSSAADDTGIVACRGPADKSSRCDPTAMIYLQA
jgi:hypothetical protein